MKTALILPGGGTRGAFEAGACLEIFKKIKPDLIVGTSVGAINGVILANGKNLINNAKKLIQIWCGSKRRDMFPYNPQLFYKYSMADSIYSHRGLYKSIKRSVSVNRLEEPDIPVHVNCTNMNTGLSEFFDEGPLLDLVVASCSLPPFFAPITIDGVPYIDGSVGSFFGIKDAKCDRIIIVDLIQNIYSSNRKNLGVFTARTSSILTSKLINDEIELSRNCADILHIKANYKDVLFTDFRYTEELIKLGSDAAMEFLN